MRAFTSATQSGATSGQSCHGHCTGYGTHACCPPMIVLATLAQHNGQPTCNIPCTAGADGSQPQFSRSRESLVKLLF